MELHTLGVDGGYTQKDVQEVAARADRMDLPAAERRILLQPEHSRRRREGDLGQKFAAGHGEDEGERVLTSSRIIRRRRGSSRRSSPGIL
jgi:uncharacterized protein (DUF1800 family)